ncbi:hypothetical protein LAV_00070 [Sphingobium phage Lacusarx]|uniref:Uncharacterized protein n=1 Tax=Sphingobium phage Lacusarx TaxID=1980139 RepID=A0A1W6DWT3_9CAUD|nr:hypothetical protein FDH44_gp070 [Sphingobium phage Lacusarx]ARK07470.1 hypothetical protein LAV_00070 [Sphingobium phage Lacusarx]
MIKHGAPPYLECSSAGDRRFSAFYARVGGKTIEEQYQAAKVFRNGDTGLSIKEAKGFRPVNAKEVAQLYAELWDRYMAEHPHLLPIIVVAAGLSDRFGRPGSVCQATELWRIRAAAITAKE